MGLGRTGSGERGSRTAPQQTQADHQGRAREHAGRRLPAGRLGRRRGGIPRYSADSSRTAATTKDRRGLRRGLMGTAFLTGSVVPVPHR